jgi:hypothetical protein
MEDFTAGGSLQVCWALVEFGSGAAANDVGSPAYEVLDDGKTQSLIGDRNDS